MGLAPENKNPKSKSIHARSLGEKGGNMVSQLHQIGKNLGHNVEKEHLQNSVSEGT